jgi:hypothetical protein
LNGQNGVLNGQNGVLNGEKCCFKNAKKSYEI